MSEFGFGSGDVVNRRVNDHMKQLLPTQISAQKDYHLEGQRVLPTEEIPGNADQCLCLLESYVGAKGQFEIHEERIFDRQTDREWRITNTITRTGAGSLSPFNYLVQSTVQMLGDVETDRSRVTWEKLGEDSIYGGREAQAAVVLTEKMSHLRARENGNGMNHAGSLSRLGSLSNIVDNARQLRTDWEELNELLGPEAETIAATVGFDQLESQETRLAAEKKGIDFFSDELEDRLTELQESFESSAGDDAQTNCPSWKTPPAELTVEETEAELRKLHKEIQRLQEETDPSSGCE